MHMKTYEPLLPLRPVSRGSPQLCTPLVPYKMRKEEFRVLTHQQKQQQQQQKPYRAASTGQFRLGSPIPLTPSALCFSIPTSSISLPSSFLKWESFVQYNNRQERQSRARRCFSRNDWQRIWGIHAGQFSAFSLMDRLSSEI